MSNVGQQLLSGALSGLATTVCLQPFDLLKTRLQQGDGLLKLPTSHSSVIVGTTREIIVSNGIRGLWRGTSPSLVRNVPGVAMYMTSLTQLRTFMAKSPYFAHVRKNRIGEGHNKNSSVLPSLTSQGNLLAGATTRVAVGFLLNPFSVLKARFESNIYAYESLTGAFTTIVRQGPSELLRGFLASSLRDAPYAGLFIVFYEGIKRETSYLLPPTSGSEATLIHGLSAASAGAIATLATHPFDVIKTKVQVRSEDRYHGFTRTVVTIWKQRGVAGYFDGASLRMSRKILSSAIGWAVYEGFLMFIRTSQLEDRD
ncbi:mitochondrial carrier [Crassisporium funariophilum]|nr:mitochondrial carrier [Crassisporium funariophilum]